MAPPPDKYVNSRADFERVLAETLQLTKKFIAENPKYPPFEDLEIQLDAMQRWIADGREPTQDERDRITIGRIVVRELEPAQTDEIYDYAQRLHSLNYTFKHWDEYPP